MVERHLILSTGAIGMALAEELVFRGHTVTYVDITGHRPKDWFPEIPDLKSESPSMEFLNEVGLGAQACYQCFNLFEMSRPLEQWTTWQRTLMQWASQNQVTLVLLETLQMLGAVDGKVITAELQGEPTTPLGAALRDLSQEWHTYLKQKSLPWVVGRASDAFGPYFRKGPLGDALFASAIGKKKIAAPSDLTQKHSFSYVPDIARALMVLGERPQAWQRRWILPSAPALSLHGLFTQIADYLKAPVEVQTISKTRQRMAALISPSLKLTSEAFGTFEEPFIVDCRPIECAYGLQGTPIQSSIGDTLQWFEDESQRRQKPPSIPKKAKKTLLRRTQNSHQDV